MLIARQKPDATNVAELRTWNSLGRFARRGEKGIFILAPMVGNKRKKDENAEQNADAKETQPTLYGFRGVYVFDITQTEGKEPPTLTEVQGDVSGYRERLVKFVESKASNSATPKGSHPPRACLMAGRSRCFRVCSPSTLTHEIAHEMLHRGDRRALTIKQVRETEAEAVAFVVCQAVGLETGTASADYIQRQCLSRCTLTAYSVAPTLVRIGLPSEYQIVARFSHVSLHFIGP
jgi:hypothetical protein